MEKNGEVFCFLKEDLDLLDKKMDYYVEKIKKAKKEMGESCRQSSETFHDNFPYEEASREYHILQKQYDELRFVRNRSRVVTINNDKKISIGKIVILEDLDTGVQVKYRFGSYMNFDDENNFFSISYEAPIAQILLGSKVGDVKKGIISGKVKSYKVIRID